MAIESPAPVISAMLADSAPKKWRATTFSVYSLIPGIVYAVALLGGGALLAWGLELQEFFYITSVWFLASSVVLALFLRETVEIQRMQPQKSRFQRFSSGVRTMATERSSLGLMLYSVFYNAAKRGYPIYIPLFMTQVFGVELELLGPIVASSWITFGVSRLIGGLVSDWFGKRKILIGLGLVLIVLFNLAMVVSSTLWWAVVFWGLIGVGDGIQSSAMTALIVDIVPSKRRGTYFGTLSLVGGIGGGAILMYGVVAELFDIRWTFLIAFVFLALAVLAVVVLIKEGKVIGEEESAS